MNVLIQSKNMHLTQALREVIEFQAKRLEKLTDRALEVRVTIETVARKNNDPSANQVTFTVFLPGKKKVVVRTHAVDMYQAIYKAARGIKRKVRKTLEKRKDVHRQGRLAI